MIVESINESYMVTQHARGPSGLGVHSAVSHSVNYVFVRAVLNGNLVVILSPLCIFAPQKGGGPFWSINLLLLKKQLIGTSGKDGGETVKNLFLHLFCFK